MGSSASLDNSSSSPLLKPAPIQASSIFPQKPAYDPSNFTEYYNRIRTSLRTKYFQFSDPHSKLSFEDKLSLCYNINGSIARVWIQIYIDFMIFMAWRQQYSKESEATYPPYAIQQVAKFHMIYTQNYSNFCMFISERRSQAIRFTPYKATIKHQAKGLAYVKLGYNKARDFFWQKVYNHPNAQKTPMEKKQAEYVWEPFEQTLIRSEFTFSFLEPESTRDFFTQIFLMRNDLKDISKAAKALRSALGAGNLMEKSKKVPDLALVNEFVVARSMVDISACTKVESIQFSAEFVNILAWEHGISIETALEWVLEYKKFLFLVYAYSASDGKVRMIPSEAVSQVWQLHLQFIVGAEYGFEDEVFETQKVEYFSLIMDKTERKKAKSIYAETLKAYTWYFGAPNAKIWAFCEEKLVGFEVLGFLSGRCLTDAEKAEIVEVVTWKLADISAAREKGK